MTSLESNEDERKTILATLESRKNYSAVVRANRRARIAERLCVVVAVAFGVKCMGSGEKVLLSPLARTETPFYSLHFEYK